MAYQISEDCIVCGKCEKHCPTFAISLGRDIYEINKKKCIECKGYYDEPICVAVCPVDVITKIPKKNYEEL